MVDPQNYIPQCGDVVRISLNPQAGHEQAGRRPAVVISPRSYNGRTRLAVLCPITSHIKGYPFEVILPTGLPITGAILSDQVKNLDWRARNAELVCTLPTEIISDIIRKLSALLSL